MTDSLDIGPVRLDIEAHTGQPTLSLMDVAGPGPLRLSRMTPHFARILGHALIAMADAADATAQVRVRAEEEGSA